MIDTHCHINDDVFISQLDEVVARQKNAGVEAIIVPGVNVESLASIADVCNRYPRFLFPAFGLHPEDVGPQWESHLQQIYEAIQARGVWPENENGVVAIGEIGLDYHWSTEYKQQQQCAFRRQLQWAIDYNLPVLVHARDAAEDTLRIVEEYVKLAQKQGRTLLGVMHCFSGSREIADAYLQLGWWLGIGGVITFKNCKLPQVLCPSQTNQKPIPLSSLLLETDAPYMTPVPLRGQPNESRYMQYVVRKLAELYNLPESEVVGTTNAAAKRLFKFK